MDRKSFIPNATNLVTLVKDAPEAVTVISTIGAIGIAKVSVLPPQYFYPAASVIVIGVGFRLRKSLAKAVRRALSALKTSNRFVLSADFETIHNKIIIDFASNGKSAIFKQQRLVRCLKTSNKYQYRFFPSGKYKKIKHNVGTWTTAEVNETLTDIFIHLDEPMQVGDQKLLELTCTIEDAFQFGRDFWCYNKYYKGKERYELAIRFPKSRIPQNSHAELVDSLEPEEILKVYYPKLTIEKKKPTLILDVNDLEHGHDLKLYFNW